MPKNRLKAFVSLCLLVSASAACAFGQGAAPANSVRREVAVTFDDLPGVAMGKGRSCDLRAYEELNRKLLQGLARHSVPATALINEGHMCGPQQQQSALPSLLKMWLDAGAELGNHSYSHRDLNNTPLALYQEDVIRGETITREVLRQRGRELKYFRHPFLHAGKDRATREAFEKFLAGRGYRLAPVTIDNQEWVFAEVYAKAMARGDRATMEKVTAAYVPYMESVFDFFEKLSVRVVGREIKQVLLLHVNPLNAEMLDELVGMMKRRGYSFITLDEALKDSAYSLPDSYAGPKGLSWLHRWALTKGMQTEEEPREPQWLADLMKK